MYPDRGYIVVLPAELSDVPVPAQIAYREAEDTGEIVTRQVSGGAASVLCRTMQAASAALVLAAGDGDRAQPVRAAVFCAHRMRCLPTGQTLDETLALSSVGGLTAFGDATYLMTGPVQLLPNRADLGAGTA